MTKVTFLGTGGGRHTTMFQARSTGGFLLETEGSRIHVDPGPGALTNMRDIGYDLRRTDAVVISHCHPDHYSDAESVIEGMTYGGWVRRGSIYGSVTVMEGYEGLGPRISPYHRGLASSNHVLRPGEVHDIAGVRTEITRSIHNDPTGVGFRFNTDDGIISYVSDTYYSDSVAEQYKGSRVLFLPITTPRNDRIKGHMCVDDAAPFINIVRPELCVFIHLGIVVLRRDPVRQAKEIEEETGVKVISGEDLMTLDIGKDIIVGQAERTRPAWNDAWNLE